MSERNVTEFYPLWGTFNVMMAFHSTVEYRDLYDRTSEGRGTAAREEGRSGTTGNAWVAKIDETSFPTSERQR